MTTPDGCTLTISATGATATCPDGPTVSVTPIPTSDILLGTPVACSSSDYDVEFPADSDKCFELHPFLYLSENVFGKVNPGIWYYWNGNWYYYAY